MILRPSHFAAGLLTLLAAPVHAQPFALTLPERLTVGTPSLVPVADAGAEAVAFGDVNGDGRPDLLLATPGIALEPQDDLTPHAWLQNADGSWPATAARYPLAPAQPIFHPAQSTRGI